MAVALHVYEVPPSTPQDPKPPPVKGDSFVIQGEVNSDEAKKTARAVLEEQGYRVRSINWGQDPTPGKPTALLGYVFQKEKPQ